MTTITTATMDTTDKSFTAEQYDNLRRMVFRGAWLNDDVCVNSRCSLNDTGEWEIEADVWSKASKQETMGKSFRVFVSNITDEEREAIENQCIEEAIENAVTDGWKVAA